MDASSAGFTKWCRRSLEYLRAVLKRSTILLLGLITGSLFAIPAWVRPLLSANYQAALDSWTAWLASPKTYGLLAKVALATSILIASFCAWNEERDSLEKVTFRLSELENDKPKLTGHISGWQTGQVETSKFGRTTVMLIDLEIVNSGGPTSVRQWQGFYRFKAGNRTFLSDRMFVEEHISLNNKRNLVSDDWWLRKGERRLGAVAFYFHDDASEIFQVAVQFQDHTGQMFTVSVPDEELMARMETAGKLPWQVSKG